MKAKSALSLAVVAGVAASATAGNTPANRSLVPLQKAGVMYINMETGERSLTLYDNAGEIPEVDTTNSTAALFDWWLATDENVCWDDPRRDGFGYPADYVGDVTAGFTEPGGMVDFGDMPFDSKITGVVMGTAVLATENTDSDGDGNLDTGIDIVTAYYDALSEGNRTSVAPPTAVVRIESIPGNRGVVVGGFDDYTLVLDFGSSYFEMGDSDGANLGDLWMAGAASGLDLSTILVNVNCTTPTGTVCTTTTTPNPSPDGLADFQYMQYYAQHGSDAKVTSDTTYVGLSAPDGQITTTSYTTPTLTTITTPTSSSTTVTTIIITAYNTFYTPDPLPQGQSAFESIGFVFLGAGGDVTNLDGSAGGCCYWFGGIDCGGFLQNVVSSVDYDPSWYNFTPLAQWEGGFKSDLPVGGCDVVDFQADGIIDNGDIGGFVAAFIGQSPSADMNGDGILDNGDIGTFVQLFLSCVG